MTVILRSYCESESRSVVSDSLQPHGLYSPWNSPGQHTGVGSHSLLQGIFPTQVFCIAVAGGFFTNWAIREAKNCRSIKTIVLSFKWSTSVKNYQKGYWEQGRKSYTSFVTQSHGSFVPTLSERVLLRFNGNCFPRLNLFLPWRTLVLQFSPFSIIISLTLTRD